MTAGLGARLGCSDSEECSWKKQESNNFAGLAWRGIVFEEHLHLLPKPADLQRSLAKAFKDQVPVAQVVVVTHQKEFCQSRFVCEAIGIVGRSSRFNPKNSQIQSPGLFASRLRPTRLGQSAPTHAQEFQAIAV